MQQKIFNFRINVYLLIGIVVLLLLFLHYFNVLKPVENLLFWSLRPIEKLIYRTGINIYPQESYLAKEKLEQENKDLQTKLSNALIENARLHSLIIKSEILQKELAFLEARKYQSVPAQVIGKAANTTSQIFILDKGIKNNIRVGLPVIYLEGILVGKIIAVEDFTSQLLLISDSASAISAEVQNETNSPGIVAGKLGLSLEMQLIPQSEKISTNQTVVTSGLEENIPAGLVIGQITSINQKTEELFQTAQVKSPASLDRISVVSIIIP